MRVAGSNPVVRSIEVLLLVHCHMGINRGPSAAYAILLTRGHDPIEAIDLVRARRPIAAVDYADDSLRWWHHRTDATITQRRADRDSLDQWRREHPHDTIRIINTVRSQQRGGVMSIAMIVPTRVVSKPSLNPWPLTTVGGDCWAAPQTCPVDISLDLARVAAK